MHLPVRIAAFVVFISFTYYLVGYYLQYSFAVQQIRAEHSVKSKLKNKELVYLELHVDSIRWIKSYEFAYRGEKYDVYEKTILNDTIKTRAFHDKEENAIDSQFLSNWEQKQRSEKATSIRFQFQLYFEFVENNFNVVIYFIENEPQFYLLTGLSDFTLLIDHPPDISFFNA